MLCATLVLIKREVAANSDFDESTMPSENELFPSGWGGLDVVFCGDFGQAVPIKDNSLLSDKGPGKNSRVTRPPGNFSARTSCRTIISRTVGSFFCLDLCGTKETKTLLSISGKQFLKKKIERESFQEAWLFYNCPSAMRELRSAGQKLFQWPFLPDKTVPGVDSYVVRLRRTYRDTNVGGPEGHYRQACLRIRDNALTLEDHDLLRKHAVDEIDGPSTGFDQDWMENPLVTRLVGTNEACGKCNGAAIRNIALGTGSKIHRFHAKFNDTKAWRPRTIALRREFPLHSPKIDHKVSSELENDNFPPGNSNYSGEHQIANNIGNRTLIQKLEHSSSSLPTSKLHQEGKFSISNCRYFRPRNGSGICCRARRSATCDLCCI